MLPALSKQLLRLTGIEIANSDWNTADLPPYLTMNFRLIDEQGKTIDESRDLKQLQENWAQEASASFKQVPDSDYEKQNLTSWSFGELPEHITLKQNEIEITAYPTLIDRKEHVDLTLVDTKEQAQKLLSKGLRRLFIMATANSMKYLAKNLPDIQQMCLYYSNVPKSPFTSQNEADNVSPCEQLKNNIISLAYDRCFILNQDEITNKAEFEQRLEDKRAELVSTANQLAQQLAKPLAEYHSVAKKLTNKLPLSAINAVSDIKQQLNYLIYQGFVEKTPDTILPRLPLYIQAINQRLEKLVTNPSRDQQWMNEVKPFWQRYLDKQSSFSSAGFEHYRWMIEEFRISLFAQGMKTAYPISAKRLEKQWASCQ